jgi:hypothetical protein
MVFSRLSHAWNDNSWNSRVLVFQRIKPTTAISPVDPPWQFIRSVNGFVKAPSYDAVVTNQRDDHQMFFWLTNSFRGAKLSGFLSSFKFPYLDWPDSTFLTWFKDHGPMPQIQEFSSFREFSFFQS